MKVSVIIPVYNVKEYLKECVESIISQSYNNIEIILINDGSTDGSEKICEEYSDTYSGMVKVINTNNCGPMYARTVGIDEATGDVLIFLDSDDCLHSDAIEIVAQVFEQKDCDMLMFNAGISGDFLSKPIEHNLEENRVYDEVTKKIIYKKIIEGKIPNSVCLKAVRRECAVFSKELAKHKMIHGEDLLMSVAFITNCKKIVYLKEGLYQYRIREGSTTNFFDINRHESLKFVHTEVEKYIEKWGVPELKPLHNARKVRGWIEQLILLIKNRKSMHKAEFRKKLRSVARDPYFRSAYIAMDKTKLPNSFRKIAFLLYHCSFLLV